MDIGRTAIKVVDLNRYKNTFELIFCRSWQTPPVPHNTNNLSTLPRLARKKAALALKDKEAFSRRFLVPKHFLDRDIFSHIECEAPHLLPLPLESLYFDFCNIEGHPIKDSKEILLIAAQKNNPNLNFELLNTLKMTALVLELESHAILRVLRMQKATLALPLGSDEGVMVIEASDTKVRMYLWTREKIVDHHAFDDEGCLAAWQPSLKALMLRNPSIKIQRFLMGGGRALDLPFVTKLKSHLDIKISILNPFASLKINQQMNVLEEELEKLAPQFLISLGLALRKFDDAY